jgi:Carboxypeptidase regulatory-like domain/TonB dependent receptor-like, beta-barrel
MSPDTLITPRSAILVALLATLLLSASAIAQVDAGAVRGTVADPTGAVVPNTKVTLTNDATGLSTSAATGSDGTYTFGPIKIGAYTISVEAAGFRKSTTHITVNVQDQARADFQLVAGAATETVEVTAAAPQLQTQDASVGTVATSQQVNDLPLNGRNYTFLAQLGAGVTKLNPTRGLDGTGSFVANGLTTVHNNYMLDGIDNNNDTVDFLNGAAYANLPPPDAIQEFKVQTSNFSAEFGRAGGAVVNAAVKSGTNQFHGSAWEFLRNDLFDATALDQWFVTPATLKKKGELRRNQYGAAAGGPIIKNKLFIFGDYEGTRIRQSVERNPSVPTNAEAASGFLDYRDRFASTSTNYTDLLGRSFNGATIFDPATTRSVTAGSADPVTGFVASGTGFVRDPFYTGGSIAGMTNFTTAAQMNLMNQLPSGRIDTNALKLLQLYPAANGPGFVNNYFANRSQPDDDNHFDVRADANFSQRDQLFGRVSYSRRHANFPGDFTGDGDDTGFGRGDFTDRSLNVAVSQTHTFSSTLINEARFGYSRLRTSAQPASALINGIPAKYGIQGIPQTAENGGLPTIAISGLTGLGAGAFASPNRRISDTIQFTENLTKVYGGHSFKGGFEYQRLHFPWIAPAWSRGQFNFGGFTGMAPGVGGATTGGVSMADILLTPTTATVPNGINNVGGASFVAASNITQPDDLRHYYGAYFQDDWKATSKLTLNMGLRWEIFGGIEEGSGKQAGLLMPNANGAGAQYAILSQQKSAPLSPAFAPLLATDGIGLKYLNDSSIFTTPLTNFAPRVGLAYQFTPKFVARGAYGVFYGGFENIGGAPDPGYDYPFTVNLAFSEPNGNILPLLYPNGQQATLENGLTAADPNPASPNFSPHGLGLIGFKRPWKTAYTQEWNGSVQYQLSQSQTITVAYVGNNTHHLLNGEKRNIPNLLLPPGTTKTPYLPFPDFQENSDYLNTNGAAYYNAVQITFERRFKQGLNLLADYTRSVCKDDFKNILGLSENQFNRASTLPGFSDLRDYTFCGNDVPNIFHASGIWQLPVGKGKLVGKNMSGAADAFIGGWSAQWIVTSQDGFPFTVGVGGNLTCPITTTSGDFNCYAPIAKGANPYAGKGRHGIEPFLNASAFVQPPAVTTIGQTDFSPLGGTWNQVHGPAFNDLDFSVFKKFRTSESTNLEFRAEFFNFLNHPNFGNGNGNGIIGNLNFLNNTANNPFGFVNNTIGNGRETEFALKFYW